MPRSSYSRWRHLDLFLCLHTYITDRLSPRTILSLRSLCRSSLSAAMMSTTSTSILVPSETADTPLMLPGMSSPEQPHGIESGNRVVRFDRECALIPESPSLNKPIVMTKSYALTLWKKRGRSGQRHAHDVQNEATDGDGRTPSTTGQRKGRAKLHGSSSDDPNSPSRVVLKVPIPTFRSPVRGRSLSTSPTVPYKLTPCLVYRDPSTSPDLPSKLPASCSASSLPMRPSLPIYHRRKEDLTIPLRECCRACEKITEECLSEGELWQEKFSKKARRRRNASLDYQCSLRDSNLNNVPPTSTLAAHTPTAVEDGDDGTDLEVDPPCNFSIMVDEVDKRRRSLDQSQPDIFQDATFPTPPASPGPFSTSFSFEPDRRDDSCSSFSSSPSNTHGSEGSRAIISDIFDSRHLHQHLHQQRLPKPIEEEEDEGQLFPLPKRTPSSTPSPRVSPSVSPKGSMACLPRTMAGHGASNDSLCSVSRGGSSQESLLKASLSRKTPVGPEGIDGSSLRFPRTGSVSPRSESPLVASSSSGSRSERLSESVAGTTAKSQHLDERRVSPPLPSKHRRSLSLSAAIPSIASSPPTASQDTLSSQRQQHRRDTKNSSLPPLPSSSSHKSPISPQSPKLSSLSLSASSSAFRRRKLSFTVPFSKVGETIRGVGVDVLKGVGSMSYAGPF